jgi:hypothetical protein
MQRTAGIRPGRLGILVVLGMMALTLVILGCRSRALDTTSDLCPFTSNDLQASGPLPLPIASTASFDFTDVTDVRVFAACPDPVGKAQESYAAHIEKNGVITEEIQFVLRGADERGYGFLYAQEGNIQKVVWHGRDGELSFLGYVNGAYQNIPWEPNHGDRKYYQPMDEGSIPETVKKVREVYDATRAHFGISWNEAGNVLSVGIENLHKNHGVVALDVLKKNAGLYQRYSINIRPFENPPRILEDAYRESDYIVDAVNGKITIAYHIPSSVHLMKSADGIVTSPLAPGDRDLTGSLTEAENFFHQMRNEAGVIQLAAP